MLDALSLRERCGTPPNSSTSDPVAGKKKHLNPMVQMALDARMKMKIVPGGLPLGNVKEILCS